MNEGQHWAQEFDQYIFIAIQSGAFADVVNYTKAGESAQLAVPSMDHFVPLLYVLGASDDNDEVQSFNDDCTLGSMSMTSYLFSQKA